MKFKVGKPIYVFDEFTELNRRLHLLVNELMHYCDKVLFIDTLYAYAPQYSYRANKHYDIFKKIFHQKIVSAYDLWDVFETLEDFIVKNKVEVVCINALNLVFAHSDSEEIAEMSRGISRQLEYLTQKYNLITVVGHAASFNDNAKRAYDGMKKDINVGVV